jgi:hypothetical protein
MEVCYGETISCHVCTDLIDVSTDLNNAQTVLRMAGIIDDQVQWKAGKTTLVQTGDIVDR